MDGFVIRVCHYFLTIRWCGLDDDFEEDDEKKEDECHYDGSWLMTVMTRTMALTSVIWQSVQ